MVISHSVQHIQTTSHSDFQFTLLSLPHIGQTQTLDPKMVVQCGTERAHARRTETELNVMSELSVEMLGLCHVWSSLQLGTMLDIGLNRLTGY